MAHMGRFRSADVSLGAVAVLANIALVAGVVLFTTGQGLNGSPGPSPTTAATRTATRSPLPSRTAVPTTPPTLTAAAVLATRPAVTVAVLGDGTGDEPGEWVGVWARLLGQDRSVMLHGLDPADPTQYAAAERLGSGARTAVVYNGSRRGASADYAAKRLQFLVPRAPDVVLLNYGRDDTAGVVAGQLDMTLRALRAAWPQVPVVVVLQPPTRDDTSAPVRSAVAGWARGRALQAIDVAAAFRAAGDPNSFVSVTDPPSVNARGGRLWAEAVQRALGGRLPVPVAPSASPPASPTASPPPATASATAAPPPPAPTMAAPPPPAPTMAAPRPPTPQPPTVGAPASPGPGQPSPSRSPSPSPSGSTAAPATPTPSRSTLPPAEDRS